MCTWMRRFGIALAAVAAGGIGQNASAQVGSMSGPAAPYPAVMAPTYMQDNGFGAGMMGPQGPYAAPAFSPASYAGMGGPAPMGPMPMGPMPMGPGSMGQGPMPQSPMMTPMANSPGMGQMGQMSPMGPGGDFGGEYGGGYGGYDCPPPAPMGWKNHVWGFGDFLFLRPSNNEVTYAVPVDSAAATGGTLIPTGKVKVADPDYAPAFRAGFGAVISPRSALAVTYAQFDRNTFDSGGLLGTTSVFHTLVAAPVPPATGGNFTDVAAQLQTRFRLLDLDYKGLLVYNPEWQVNYVAGARYGQLEQHFTSAFTSGLGSQDTVLASSEFDGGGIHLGLEGLRFHPKTQFFWYGRGYTSFLAGTFRGHYEMNSAATTPPSNLSFNVGRVVTMLDLESGLGWQNWTGNVRFSGGYMFSAWYNTVRVNDLITAVQQNQFIIPSTSLRGVQAFDGLVMRVEVLW